VIDRSEQPWEAVLERDGHKVSKSPWGPDDEIGRLNWITPESQAAVLSLLAPTKVFDLSVSYFLNMPGFFDAGDPKFDIWMTHTPGGSVLDGLTGVSPDVQATYTYSGDAITMYTHTGTHMDMLNHYGYHGCFWNGWTPEQHLGSRHWTKGGADKYPNIIARGVLLDIAGLHGVDCLPDSYEITPNDVASAAREQGTELRRGDVVMIRTGRMIHWPNYEAYAVDAPGIGLEAARYLCEETSSMCLGSDNDSLEYVPCDPETFFPVHSYMFATAGAQIIESLWLEELAAEGIHEVAFIGGPLKLTGSTGSPMRPLAIPLAR
jgi:kynurenine formamidase